MQRIYACELTVEQYVETQAHRQVMAERVCPICGASGGLRRHGTYERGVTTQLGQAIVILIARFLCEGCARTVSYLPGFALSYRLVSAATFEAFLDGRHDRRDVQAWGELLKTYRRRMAAFGPNIVRVVGFGLGLAPPPPAGLWPWLKEACGGLAAATRRLVALFKITVFKRYQCHQPAA